MESGRAAAGGVLAAACISTFVVNANTSAVTILLPTMSEDTGASVSQLQWAVTGYMLVGAAVIVTSGALGDVFGRRRVFLGGLLLFIASCALIALSTGGAGIIVGRLIQGAAGATIVACGMSLLSVAASGKGQMKAITLWGAASAAGAAMGPLIGGALVDLSGWQGLFWLDGAIAAGCVVLAVAKVEESSDPERSRSIDFAGTVLIAAIFVPLVLGFSEGADWGWTSAATLGCFVGSVVGAVLFVIVEKRVSAPIVDLDLLRNQVLVGATLAILIVAGTINGLMYVLSLYLQDSAAFGLSPLETGVATLPAAAAMIAVTPLITPVAARIGTRLAIVAGFGLAAAGFGALALVEASWSVRAARPPAGGALCGARPREWAGVVGVDCRGPRGAGGAGIRDLEHGALHRRVGRGGRGRDDLQFGHERRACEWRIALGCARLRRLAGLASDGGLLRSGYRDRIAHGSPLPAPSDRDRPRGGGGGSRVAHHPDPAHAAPRKARWSARARRRHLGPVTHRSTLAASLRGCRASDRVRPGAPRSVRGRSGPPSPPVRAWHGRRRST